MTELKCPFCRRKLKTFAKYTDGTSTVYCSKCNLFGDSKLFEELTDTKKKLDIANTELNYIQEQIAKNKVFEQINNNKGEE